MNPGATISPVASIRRSAATTASVSPKTIVSRPSRIPTAPANPGAPLPSTIVPFSIRRSNGSVIGRDRRDLPLERGP